MSNCFASRHSIDTQNNLFLKRVRLEKVYIFITVTFYERKVVEITQNMSN